MTQLAGTYVLLTGASGGFGREMVRQFLAAGSRLILTDLHHADLEDTAKAAQEGFAKSLGEVVALIEADLSTRDGCESLYQAVEGKALPVDVLVNNAGIAQFGLFHQVPTAAWETLLEINLLSPMHLTRLFLPAMLERRRGHLVNISSVAGWTAAPGIAPYSAAKFGLRGFGEAMAGELEESGVSVTNVYPFFSRTPILDSPNHGDLERPDLPDNLVVDPSQVVQATLDGIRHDRLHVFTDRFGRLSHRLVRWAPWALNWLRKRLQKRRAKASV